MPPAELDRAGLLEKFQTALIRIEVSGRDADGKVAKTRLGAGVLVGDNGLIITAGHVVGEDDEWRETTPNSGLPDRMVSVFGLDEQRVKRDFGKASVWKVPGYDIALLEVTAQSLSPAPLAEKMPNDSGKLVALIWDPDGVPRPIEADLEPTDKSKHFGLLTVRLGVAEGHSGSGLFNAQARLVGIIVNRLDDSRALAVPAASIREHVAARARAAAVVDADPAALLEMQTELQKLRQQTASVRREIDWMDRSHADGWYELFELRKELDQYGDSTQITRLRRIHGPDLGCIETVPYRYSAAPSFGTCVLNQLTDEQKRWSEKGLPRADTFLEGNLELKPAATATDVHAGFSVSVSSINSFAMTEDEARQRNQDPIEYTTIRARYPARMLRLVVMFPYGYQPAEITVVAQAHTADHSQGPEDSAETARVASSLFFDRERGCAVLSVERSLPEYQYALTWKLPPPPVPPWDEVTRAREQVRTLLELREQECSAIEERIGTIRDEVWQKFFAPRGKGKTKAKLHLSVLLFDEPESVIRVVLTTMDDQIRKVTFPPGVGVAGWVMKRRRPAFVDTHDAKTYGVYRKVKDTADERHLLCVPLPLPADSDQRAEMLGNRAMPCLVAALTCHDESGNMNSLKQPDGKLMAQVCSELLTKVLDVVLQQPLS